MSLKRPDLRAYFRAHIDRHVHGLIATTRIPNRPVGVERISGDVTDSRITVTMTDGTQWHWRGGQYASRKVAGCYAPKMPTPDGGGEVAP